MSAGCASIFRSTPPRVEIIGPDDIKVSNTHGEHVQGYEEGDERFAKPDPNRDDSLVVSYHGKTHTVALAKQMSPWVVLDLLSYGPGFVIDDMSRWWYSYMPVYVHVDSTGSDFNLSSQNWLGEPAGTTRPSLLLIGGVGLTPPSEPSFFGFLRLPTKVQGGIGVDFNKTVEVFYLGQDEIEYDLEPGTTFLGIRLFGDQTEITWQSIAARFFLPKTSGFFVQSSFGWGHATGDTVGTVASNKDQFFSISSNSFPVIGAGIGWTGDISFVTLQYVAATRRFSIMGYDGVLFHSLYLDFGLNLRF